MFRRPRRAALMLLAGLSVGVAGESLLFLRRQCARVEQALREDFRVVLFLRRELEDGKARILEERLRAMPEVEEARGFSPRQALERLRRSEPELVDSVLLLGDNPLSPAYEVRLAEGSFGRLEDWISRAQGLAEWADIRYKPAQAEAILQAQFYERFLGLALSALACLLSAAALAALVWTARAPKSALRTESSRGQGLGALSAAAGAALGAAAVFGLLAPMRHLSAWWAWPGLWSQAWLIVCSAAAGWVLSEPAPEA